MTKVKSALVTATAVAAAAIAMMAAVPGIGASAHMKPLSAAIDAAAASSAVTCVQGRTILERKGYSRIKAFDCHGTTYRFSVYKGSIQMVVLMSADSAGYVEVR